MSYESIGELGRAFDQHRTDHIREHDELHDQVKFVMRLVIGTLCSAILAGVVTSFLAYIRGTPGG